MERYLKSKKEICKFITCGSVDNGKSTLIGRMLYDSKNLYKDQIESLKKDSKRIGSSGDEFDFALLLDGLSSEREQGITIDVAYRYFSLENRRYVIIDTPGHKQYTKNMATGASNADIAIILLDAREGVVEQSKRHSYIASLLGIKQFIIAINKMDLVQFSEEIFIKISNDYYNMLQKLPNYQSINVHFIPICATMGDNVVFKSKNTSWYDGGSLLALLESLPISDKNSDEFILSVQYVNRPNLDFRGFCGSIISGNVVVGSEVIILPSKQTSKVKEILNTNNNVQSADYKNAITIRLEDEIDIQRGDIIASVDNSIEIQNEFYAMIICFGEFDECGNYLIKISHSIIPMRFEILQKKRYCHSTRI